MKRPLHLLLTVLTLFFFQHSFSQAICGFDIMHARKMKEDPGYRKNVLASENSIREYLRQHPVMAPPPRTITPNSSNPASPGSTGRGVTSGNPTVTSGNPTNLGGPPYTIPVVVNVINTGDPIGDIYNPTDAQIEGAIAYLNAVYNGAYPGMDNVNGAGNLQIQFVLAQRDPNCNPTNGINRVDGSGVAGYVSGGVNSATTLGTNDINIKNLSRWDPTQYYNVWIVNKIDGNDGTSGQFIAGYAYFPGSSPLEDGIVMLATQMVAGQKTLPHEIGHAFNLYHPFEGSTDASICPVNTNCSLNGDQVCDTDPISENINSGTGVIDFTCRTGMTNSCTNTPYTPKTESNFMNYTFCFTLFTAGQAARMQASASTSRSGLTTSLGGTAPAGGGCSTPKIDFELTGDQVTETTVATSGCRSYKDYSYNMIIGAGPSAAATATLNVVSGTAKQGLDFDLTTNGSFTSPSQQLNFGAGATVAQPFTIRIYDDASVNGTRNVTLGLTVNSGGGNAIAGDGRPNFTMIIHDNDLAPTAGVFPVGSTIIGAASATTTIMPFDATQTSLRSQFLYRASELTAAGIPAGPLTGLSIQVNAKNSVRPFANFNIKLGTASTSFLVNTTGVTYGSSMTIVKSLASYATTSGWNNFTFDMPYIWDGASNIVVEICYDNGSAAPSDAGDKVVFYVDGGANQGNAIFQQSIDCSYPFTGITYLNSGSAGFKPRITFAYGEAATLVQSALITSQSQYLGPNADAYFYDPTNTQLMARIQNLSSFDYGCTQVVIDRAGTNATQFWNTNVPNYLFDKTFHVI
ncbi:MAG TPA: M43 family zinc metalloprotease, partial [Puia sp.]|nr:M43 family zinc metalloprotease [Puia sp.]